MKDKTDILEEYKTLTSKKIFELNSISEKYIEAIKSISRIFFVASGGLPTVGSAKTILDAYRQSSEEKHQWMRRFDVSYLSYCDGKNIKNQYRTDFFSLSEQDQATILKRQFDFSQEQKRIAETLKRLNGTKLCYISAEYEESRESITSALVYAIFLDKFKNDIEKADSSFNDFMTIKNYIRSLKVRVLQKDEADNSSNEIQITQKATKENEQEFSKNLLDTDKESENSDKIQIEPLPPMTNKEALSEHKSVTIPNDMMLNALKVLETSSESENTHIFFNHIAETVLRTYEKSILELYYASIAQIANVEQTELIQYICEDAERTKELFETLANNEAFLRYKKNLKSGQEFEFVLKEFLEIHNKLNELMKEQKIQYTLRSEFKELLSHFKQFNEQQLAEISMLLDQNQHGLAYIKNLVEYDLASSISDFDELKNTLVSLSVKSQKNHQIKDTTL